MEQFRASYKRSLETGTRVAGIGWAAADKKAPCPEEVRLFASLRAPGAGPLTTSVKYSKDVAETCDAGLRHPSWANTIIPTLCDL